VQGRYAGQIGQLPVPDADRSSRPLDKLQGGVGGGGGSPKNVFRPFGPHSGLNIRGAGTPDPSPGSGTGYGTLK